MSSDGREPAATLVVEATSWQSALQGAYALRGESVSLDLVTVELIPKGYRALNTETHAAYELRKAPDDAPLSQAVPASNVGPFADEDTFAPTSSELAEVEEMALGEPPAPGKAASPADEAKAVEDKDATKAAPKVGVKPLAGSTKTPAKGLSALKGAENKAPRGAVKAPDVAAKAPVSAPRPKDAPKGAGSAEAPPVVLPPWAPRAGAAEGQATQEAKPRPSPPALPTSKPVAAPPPAPEVAAKPKEAAKIDPGQVLFSRGEDPSARSPLTYREVALCLPEGTAEPEAERVLRGYLQSLIEQLAPAPAGKYIALAAFDVRFTGRPPKPPLVTLTWKDWRGAEPKVAYPAQQKALNASMAGVGMSMGGVFPSPFASLPGNVAAPTAQGQPSPMPAAGAPASSSYEVLFSRGENPSARSPLTYREVALCLPEGTAEPEAERVLRGYLQSLIEQLAPAPAGKYIALAAFDVRFTGRPPKPPLVTLTWKDWRGAEPKVAYPAQQRALLGSMGGVGMSMGGVFPSPFASLPGNVAAPSPFGAAPAAAPAPSPFGAAPAAAPAPFGVAPAAPGPSPFNAAMPGGGMTMPLPRADLLNVAAARPASAPPPSSPSSSPAPSRPPSSPAPSRPGQGAARSPRDSKPSGGGEGGGSSEGWPPAAPGVSAAAVSAPPKAAAGPTVPAHQRPLLQPLPGKPDISEEMPTAVAASPLEAWFEGHKPQISVSKADSTDSHEAVSTGEFAIVDEPTPMLNIAAASPEAFREELKLTREQPVTAPGARHAPRPSPAKPAAQRDDGVLAELMKVPVVPQPVRYASSSDLVAQLFEAMPALQAIESEREGVDFVIELLATALPSRVIFCHVYDAPRREFSVAGARAPSPSAAGRLLGARTPELDPSLEPVLGHKGALVVPDVAKTPRQQGGRWALAGEAPRSLAAVAVRGQGRLLGLIELGNPSDGSPFGEPEGRALEYVAEKFAEFLSRVGAGAPSGGR